MRLPKHLFSLAASSREVQAKIPFRRCFRYVKNDVAGTFVPVWPSGHVACLESRCGGHAQRTAGDQGISEPAGNDSQPNDVIGNHASCARHGGNPKGYRLLSSPAVRGLRKELNGAA